MSWDWSQSCQAWRLPLIQQLVKRFQPYFAIIRGCRVGLVDKQGDFVSKGWKVMTTSKMMAQRLNMPCQCPHHVRHVRREGNLTSKTAFYTPQMAKRICDVILQGVDDQEVMDEMASSPVTRNVRGWYDM